MSNRFLIDGTDALYGVRVQTLSRSANGGFQKHSIVYGPYGSLGVARGMATRRGGEGVTQTGNTTKTVEVVTTELHWTTVASR